jgi:hypothetical protein
MSLDSIRSSIVATVAGVSGINGIAPVYDYARHVTNLEELRDLQTTVAGVKRVHFWSVAPARERPVSLHRRGICQDAMYRWEIHGFYALKDADASEKALLVIAEGVFDALRNDPTLGGTVRYGDEDVFMAEHDHRMMAGTLCHHVSFRFACKVQVAG